MPETKIQARWYAKGPRAKGAIDLVVVHTMESAEKGATAESVAKYFATTDRKASAHWCIDADSEVRCVDDADIAYHAPGASHRSIGLEHAGFARQSPAEWADEYSTQMLLRSARLAASICRQYGIPVRFVDAAGLRAGAAGITTHAEVSKAFPDKGSGHWDPGPHFPMLGYLADVGRELARLEAPPVGRALVTESLPIVGGTASISATQAIAHLADGTTKYTRQALSEIVAAYMATCERAGVDVAIPLGQLAHETGPEPEARNKRGPLTSDWSQRPYRNPAGIGVTGQHASGKKPSAASTPANHIWMWHETRQRWEVGVAFPAWTQSAPAHVGRLLGYALVDEAATAKQRELIAEAARWRSIPSTVRGGASTLAELGKARNPRGIGWASPGTEYGARIADQINRLRAR